MTACALATLMMLGGISLASCDANVTVITATVKPEIIELVNVIKQDLRKNNDDYAEHLPRLGAPRSAYLNLTMKTTDTTPADRPLPFKNRLEPEDTRRRFDPMQGHRAKMYMNNVISRAGSHAGARYRRKPDPRKLQALAEKMKLQSLMKNNYPKKYVNGDKTDKLKMFIQKNKGKLQEFVNNKKQQAMMKARPAASDGESSDRERLKFTLPDAEHLDMAPAQGARIHTMRLKGRLCLRNVMFPEGPKYDSKGQIYLKAHGEDRKRLRHYDQTAPPKIVLPKCCNCCQKSVLGCE